MGYVLHGVVGRAEPAGRVGEDLDLPVVDLAAQGFSLVLWTPEDFDRLGASDRDSEPPGFLYSHCRLLEVLALRAGADGLAYVEAEFHGGLGDQGAVLYRDGAVEWLSARGPIGKVMAITPISEALSRLGVDRHGFSDEFDALALHRYRETEDWLQEL